MYDERTCNSNSIKRAYRYEPVGLLFFVADEISFSIRPWWATSPQGNWLSIIRALIKVECMIGGMHPSAGRQPPTPTRRVHQILMPVLEDADAVVYALVGLVFLVAAFGMLGYTVAVFSANLRDTGFALADVTFWRLCRFINRSSPATTIKRRDLPHPCVAIRPVKSTITDGQLKVRGPSGSWIRRTIWHVTCALNDTG